MGNGNGVEPSGPPIVRIRAIARKANKTLAKCLNRRPANQAADACPMLNRVNPRDAHVVVLSLIFRKSDPHAKIATACLHKQTPRVLLIDAKGKNA